VTKIWSGKDRRGVLPGRRFGDLSTCPLHDDHHSDLKELKDTKLDKWVFRLFVSSVVVLIVVASTMFGYVASRSIRSSEQIAVLQVNQNRLLKHFDIPTVRDPEDAKEILANGKDK